MKKIRTAARELALNVLYQVDAAALTLEDALETALENADLSSLDSHGRLGSEEAKEYVRKLCEGVVEKIDMLDGIIKSYSKDWTIDRQPVVDRNIIRMALYEILYLDDIPFAVSVDEAIEMAKKFSTADSGKFVNGILARYLREESIIDDSQDS